MWLVKGKYKGSKELDASYNAVSVLAYQPSAFLAFSLPLLSHHPFPSFFVVGPHRLLIVTWGPGDSKLLCGPTTRNEGKG